MSFKLNLFGPFKEKLIKKVNYRTTTTHVITDLHMPLYIHAYDCMCTRDDRSKHVLTYAQI